MPERKSFKSNKSYNLRRPPLSAGRSPRPDVRRMKKEKERPETWGFRPYLAPGEGFEPPTSRLTAGCSTAELPRIISGPRGAAR